MAAIVYLDTAATCFRRHGSNAPPWEPHLVRVAMIREVNGDADADDSDTILVRPEPGWIITPETFPYHKAGAAEFDAVGQSIGDVAQSLQTFLQGATTLVWHGAFFHQRMLASVFADAGIEMPPVTWMPFDTMEQSTDMVRVRLMSQNRWKPPNLAEAFHHFTRRDFVGGWDWYTHAQATIDAVRDVYRGIMRERGT